MSDETCTPSGSGKANKESLKLMSQCGTGSGRTLARPRLSPPPGFEHLHRNAPPNPPPKKRRESFAAFIRDCRGERQKKKKKETLTLLLERSQELRESGGRTSSHTFHLMRFLEKVKQKQSLFIKWQVGILFCAFERILSLARRQTSYIFILHPFFFLVHLKELFSKMLNQRWANYGQGPISCPLKGSK